MGVEALEGMAGLNLDEAQSADLFTWLDIEGMGLVMMSAVPLFTIFTVWAGARIFRTAILIQGQKPSVANLFKYAFKG